ncbi:coiled-coil domain-containing protein 146 isoform X1 [Acanthopagrus latus]|uniref:coiled-coil domain-containing protein 146 isoform X1 n=1 Tax=Acanthopagrus latus TaxID=8177 RepID=UPI00187C1366|nr:coiled-coil domain-containing protein 146 isoform X1 [Acanthopagrus latus]XP_036978376.1 coiled-coil domain-containing protein 146 isoform X1 [Acanthopagrus latus]XP_036978377.1 coiled-coil domain-containing protein 146 isoform X1 [Acanthopagrus latus]
MSLSEEEHRDRRPLSRGKVGLEDQEEEEEEKGMEKDAPLVALAPDAALPEEQTSAAIHVSASPAFQCLDELLSLGKISQTRVAKLKSSYMLLHNTLKSSQDSEIQLLGEAKRCRAELERLQAEVERTEEQSTSEEPESEVNELRQQLLQAYNELKAAEDREYKTQHKLKCLWEEKQYLERESEIQPEPAELENRTKALQDKYEDLKKEVAQRQLEVRSLMEDVKTHETQILKEQKELEDKKEIIELKEAEKARLISTPDQILKEIERKRFKKEAAMKKTEALNGEISDMEQQVREVEQRNHSLRLNKKAMNEELEDLRAQVEAGQRQYRQLLKELEVRIEEEAQLTGNRGILEMKLHSIMSDRKHLYESQSVQLREKNRQMQALKRMEHALTTASEQLKHTQSIYSDLQAQLDAVPKSEAGTQQGLELQKEVDALKVSFEKKLSVAEEESQKKWQYGMIQGLLRKSNCLREELHNLRCLTQIKAEERGQKHRELLRAEQLKQHIQQELIEKDLIIMDHNKLNTMLQRRLSQYCNLCNMIMEEKNKYVKLKQIAAQTIAELKEQVKVQDNELEIQRTIVINKDRSLTKAHMKISNSSKLRDKLRNDISKVSWKHSQITQECEDNKLELMKLTHMINAQEEALLEINKNHEKAIQRRNFLGIQLLEHEEVLLNCYEKVNVQEAAINKGNMGLETLEKEMRDLQLEINEEKRQIDLMKKEGPLMKRLEKEIATLQIELSEARDKTLEGLNRTVDYKELKGKDPSTVELVKKIEQLEVKLAERERQVLERELLVDQVTRLSKPLSEQAENCRQDRLTLAKKLNEFRAHIMDTNQRLMAVSAELSMKQAAALSLQQEIREKEHQMDRCQQQLEQGLPPCPEMEEEWRRMLRDKKRRQRDKEERERRAEEAEWIQLPNGVYTTAEPRPNAYIPQSDGALPLPKPYGAQAPFKPSQPGANMRHIRKPTLKPLEM